ncbi:response regulator [Candidatus Synechococcus calcipolaris G9]|uniref:Response regulator n=1 Tax=Candidatus Synechococcus calcipolaris G9 TaxID=1497997 RepID=A0ABT6EZJ6_9SYNE|nr:response regulator [Candidatus Synechococcus calcipolaris]MDG2990998.1 response regulator [Candidatus Synechococcus calcipolaris G9]
MQAFDRVPQPSDHESDELTSLIQALAGYQESGFSGVIKISTKIPHTQRRLCYFLGFQDGNLTFSENKIPSPEEFVQSLGRYLKVGIMDSLMQYASNRTTDNPSVRELLEAIVSTRALSWDDLEKATMSRITVILERLLPYSCVTHTEADVEYDLSFGDDRHGISYEKVLERINERQKLWKQYLPIISSVEGIPHLREGVLPSVKHEPTAQHLKQWVNGKNSIADIAEALHQDPLTLAPLYLRWANEGLISVIDDHQPQTSGQTMPVVLTVDDSPIVQAMIRRALCENYEVIGATSAIDALGILNNRNVSLIFLDVTMPEIDGLEFCRTIRKIEKFKEIPVIMLTAKDGLIDRAKGHMAGTSRYLTKPVDKEMLLNTVQEFI